MTKFEICENKNTEEIIAIINSIVIDKKKCRHNAMCILEKTGILKKIYVLTEDELCIATYDSIEKMASANRFSTNHLEKVLRFISILFKTSKTPIISEKFAIKVSTPLFGGYTPEISMRVKKEENKTILRIYNVAFPLIIDQKEEHIKDSYDIECLIVDSKLVKVTVGFSTQEKGFFPKETYTNIETMRIAYDTSLLNEVIDFFKSLPNVPNDAEFELEVNLD